LFLALISFVDDLAFTNLFAFVSAPASPTVLASAPSPTTAEEVRILLFGTAPRDSAGDPKLVQSIEAKSN
jgi:hypothetical protein